MYMALFKDDALIKNIGVAFIIFYITVQLFELLVHINFLGEEIEALRS